MSKSSYMNNFTFSMQNLTCTLGSRAQAPNIEKSNFGTVLDDKKIIEENFIFMPVEVAKELAISILHVVGANEKRTGLKVKLSPEKQELWEGCMKELDAFYEHKKAESQKADETD